jgi:hypothetical protein
MPCRINLLVVIFLFLAHETHCQDIRPNPAHVLFSQEEAKFKNRAPYPPFITGDGFRDYCDFILDEEYPTLDVSKISEQNTIFVATHFLEVFFKLYHPYISGKYILVTHNSDEAAPGAFASFLEDDKLIAWFAQNVEGPTHPKLFPIPIGLENRYWPRGADFSLLNTMINHYTHGTRDILAYLNVTPRARSDRDRVVCLFKESSYCKHASGISYVEYLTDLGRSKFVLSPRGNGLDCLRTWEALHMGAIPIVKTSACDEMYKNLPVLIVQDWEDITEEFLNVCWNEMSLKQYNLDKIYLNYWLELINYAKTTGTPSDKNSVENKLPKKTNNIRVVYTAALLPACYETRKEEYIRSLRLFQSYNYEPYVIEACFPRPSTFFEEHAQHVFYSNVNDYALRNKGVNEAKSLIEGFKHYQFNESDMIVKVTGRYHLESRHFLNLVEENPEIDVFVKCDPYYPIPLGSVLTGCFAMRYHLFKEMLENLDFIKMEDELINLEAEVALFVKKLITRGNKVMYVDKLDVSANVGVTCPAVISYW